MSTNEEKYDETTKKYDKEDKEKTDYKFGPPPSSQNKPPFLYKKLGKPNELYTYKNIKGEIEFVIFRDNTKAKKEIKPYTYSTAINGWVNALPKGKAKRTLYKAEVLGETIQFEKEKSVPDDKLTEILIVEGEKACNKAMDIFPDPVVMSWSNGTKSMEQSDWSVIQGRKVYLWADHDKTGYEAMIKIAKKLTKDNEVYFVQLEQNEFPMGWDLADKLPNGVDDKFYQKMLDESLHWSKVKDTINPQKFDILNPLAFVWVEEPKRFRVLSEQTWLDKEQLNFRYGRYNKNPFDYLKKQGVMMAWTTAYMPNRGMLFEMNGIKYLNAYSKGDIHGVKKDITPWLKSLDKFFEKDGDDLHYYNQTIAHLIQKPEEKRTWCHHKGGVQGNGKTVKDRVVALIAGEHHCNKITNDVLFSDFNDYLENKLVIFIEELNIEGKKKASMMNKIKDPISSSEHLINKKMVPLYKHHVPNKWFSNSNFISPVYLEETDRRFYIYWSKADKWDVDYVKEMVTGNDGSSGWLYQKENLEGIRYFYENYDLKGFNPSHPKMTPHKQSLIFHHEKDLFNMLDEFWEDGVGPFAIGWKDREKGMTTEQSHSLISSQDIAKWCRLDNLYGGKQKMWIDNKQVFEWAITRGGKPLARKSYRCADGKKRNLITMSNQEQWIHAEEGKVKAAYKPPQMPEMNDYRDGDPQQGF